jgi:hypothetical protein
LQPKWNHHDFHYGDDYSEEHPSRVASAAKKRAQEHHRSLNKGIISTLHSVTGKAGRVNVDALVPLVGWSARFCANFQLAPLQAPVRE